MPLWDSIKAGAKKAGDAAAVQAKKAKLKADIVLADREILNRQRAFGVAMYDHVAPLSQSSDFYAAEDPLTTILRPALIIAQKEIQALAAKRVKLKEQLAAAETNRASAFLTKAESAGQKISNFGKATVMHGGETKIKTELAVVDRKIKGHKQEFGIALFSSLVEKEDKDGWLPTDRQVRNMYDTARGDVQRLENTIKAKREEIVALGGGTSVQTSTNTNEFTPPQLQPPPQNAFSDNPTSGSSMGGAGGFTDSFSSAPFATSANNTNGTTNNNDGPVDLLL